MTLGKILFLPVFACAAIAAFFSYNELSLVLDPYNVIWQRREVPREAWVVEQFRNAKIRHLMNSPGRYDGIILANSRGTANKTSSFNRSTGRRFFNLTTSADTPYGYLLKARWLASNQKGIRDVVVLLWWDQFGLAPTSEALIIREHPEVNREGWISHYWAFSNLPYQTSRTVLSYYVKRLVGLPTNPAKIVYDGFDEESGDVTVWGPSYSEFEPSDEDRRMYDEKVSRDEVGRLRFHDTVLEPDDVSGLAQRLSTPPRPEQLNALNDIAALLKQNGIGLHCVVVPMPTSVVSLVPRDKYIAWLRFVGERCGGYWDFSFPSRITRDNYNYWDWSHFLAHTAHMMLLKVMGGHSPDLDQNPDFGRYVDSAKIERHAADWEAVFATLPPLPTR